MTLLNKLVQNEMMKLLAKKRLIVIAVIVAVLVGLFTYAQYKQTLERQEKLGHNGLESICSNVHH